MRWLAAWLLVLACPSVLAGDASGPGTLWSEKELRVLRSLSLLALPSPPPSHSNRVAYDPKAAELGRRLFFDARFSRDGNVACSTCHVPSKYFTDQRALGLGQAELARNTPTLVGSAWMRWFYWDGRRDSLWAQALVPFEAVSEMGSTRTEVVGQLCKIREYRLLYEAGFGPLPQAVCAQTLELSASPIGSYATQEAWYRLPAGQRHQINRVFSNMGKSIAAYERTLVPESTRFDRYVEQLFGGQKEEPRLSEKELEGIRLFIDQGKTQCMQCHNGPLLSDGDFHNIGTGRFDGDQLDFGRMLGIPAVLRDEFNCQGTYSDAHPDDCHALRFLDPHQHHIPLNGAFKTPSLRGLDATAPYLHDGRFSHLDEVLAHYTAPPEGDHELRPMPLSPAETEALLAFLGLFAVAPAKELGAQ